MDPKGKHDRALTCTAIIIAAGVLATTLARRQVPVLQ
jgi:hypothetical protein